MKARLSIRRLRRASCAALWIGTCTVASAGPVLPVPPAYQRAAQKAGLPAAVLYAVALQESGLRLRDRLVPWPWTLNVAGRAERYASRAAACAGLNRALTRTSPHQIDAGLGQVNLGYQAHRYAAPCDLLDPYRNLTIAAQILQEQHLCGENWLMAVGRYHRPAGGTAAARYRLSVDRYLAQVLAPAPPLHHTTP